MVSNAQTFETSAPNAKPVLAPLKAPLQKRLRESANTITGFLSLPLRKPLPRRP
jgi:hypothetical protein